MPTLSEIDQVLTNTQTDGENASSLWQDPSGTVTLRNGDTVDNLRKRLASVGYYVPVAFTTGLSVTDARFTVTYNGITYAANPEDVPFTTTSTFTASNWRVPGNSGTSIDTVDGEKVFFFDTLAALIADSNLAYTGGGSYTVSAGDVVRVVSEGFDYIVVATGTGVIDTSNSVSLDPLRNSSGEFNVKAYGAKGDGSTDDATALQAAIDDAELNKGTVKVPPGTYRYGSELTITEAIRIVGSGIRDTIFQPMPTYTGWFMGVTESNFVGTSNQGPTVTLSSDTSGLDLQSFSVRSSRNLGVGNQHGIRFIQRNDRVRMRDVYFECLEGTAIYMGHPHLTTVSEPAYVRECDLYGVEVRGCGDASNPSWIIDGYGTGDSTNLCNFYACRMVYSWGVGLRIIANSTGNAIRRLKFFGLLLHGPGSSGITTTENLLDIQGDVRACDFFGLQVNSTLANQNAIETSQYLSEDPQDLRFFTDVSSGAGETFAFTNGEGFEVNCNTFASTGTDVTVSSGVTGPVIINTPGVAPSVSIDSSVERFVSHSYATADEIPLRADKLVFGDSATSPQVTQGSGTAEASVSAPAGSMYLNRDQDSERDSDALMLKRGGSGNTGWDYVMVCTGGNTASKPSSPTTYQMYLNTETDTPEFYDGSSWLRPGMLVSAAPAALDSTGILGQYFVDGSYAYFCVGTDSWVRVAVGTW